MIAKDAEITYNKTITGRALMAQGKDGKPMSMHEFAEILNKYSGWPFSSRATVWNWVRLDQLPRKKVLLAIAENPETPDWLRQWAGEYYEAWALRKTEA